MLGCHTLIFNFVPALLINNVFLRFAGLCIYFDTVIGTLLPVKLLFGLYSLIGLYHQINREKGAHQWSMLDQELFNARNENVYFQLWLLLTF